jgi:hypothetical protein
MVAETQANSIEIIAQWYCESINSTELYPIVDTENPQRTSTDDELRYMINYAHSLGLRTVLTPMVDPDMTLPANAWCYTASAPSHCGWRGQIGQDWGDDCSDASPWGVWWRGSYAPMILHYAALAAATNVTAFLVQHELYTAAEHCPARWEQLISQVRRIYPTGLVSAAFFGDILDPQVQQTVPYVKMLDFLGIDCYSGPGPLPNIPYGPVNYSHPVLPWQNVELNTLIAAKRTLMAQYEQTAQWAGLQIVCTEVGFQSRPWSYAGYSGVPQLDGADCSVIDQCVSMSAQVLAYQAYLTAFYAPENEWFAGSLFWLWRADPTAGGLSDDGFGVNGKPAVALIRAFWQPLNTSHSLP